MLPTYERREQKHSKWAGKREAKKSILTFLLKIFIVKRQQNVEIYRFAANFSIFWPAVR